MRVVHLGEQHAEEAFALRAAKAFAGNPRLWTFTDGEIAEDVLFGVKWGAGSHAVLCFRVANTPVIYADIIPESTDVEAKK